MIGFIIKLAVVIPALIFVNRVWPTSPGLQFLRALGLGCWFSALSAAIHLDWKKG